MRLESLLIPKPKANEVLVKTRATGVCMTDLHIAKAEVRALFSIFLFILFHFDVVLSHTFFCVAIGCVSGAGSARSRNEWYVELSNPILARIQFDTFCR